MGEVYFSHTRTGFPLFYPCGIITIYYECPCRIEISHPRGWKFNQGRDLSSPSLNSDPEGGISLSYMDRVIVDYFSPTFQRFLVGT